MPKPATDKTRRMYGEIIAKFAVGIEAVDDDIGTVCVSKDDAGFFVFINCGLLPSGEGERYFASHEAAALDRAYEFALSLVGRLITDQVVPS